MDEGIEFQCRPVLYNKSAGNTYIRELDKLDRLTFASKYVDEYCILLVGEESYIERVQRSNL